MRRISVALLVGLLTIAAAPASDAQGTLSGANDALRKDIDFARTKVYPALVNIQIIARRFSNGRALRGPGAGSGVIVSPGGHVLTNFHVAGHTVRIVCTLPTGERLHADVVAHDPLTDLSVLKLRLRDRADPNRPLPFATLGNSDALVVGDYALAMGNPLTLSSSLTLGVVSNKKRVFTDFTGTDMEQLDLGDGERTGMFTRWIQHDALILPGNSGGPLVNLRGEVIGINELGGNGVGFAIPSNLAATVLNQVMTFGEVRRGWLGFSVLPVDKLGREKGALVSYVVPDSPADRAGLCAGMILRVMGDRPTDVRFFEEIPLLYERIAELAFKEKVALYVEKVGETAPGAEPDLEAHIATVAPMEKYLGDEEAFRSLGLTVRNITGPMALARRYPTTRGVLVTGLRPGFPIEKARPRIEPGDIIVSVAGKPVPDHHALREVLREITADEVLVSYLREDANLLTVVRPKREKKRPGGGELPKAWLGLETQVLTAPVARALGLGKQHGFRVTRVYRWTQAKKAGLRPGDLLVALDDEPLDAFRQQDARDLQRRVREMSIGDEIELAVLRDGKKQVVSVELEESPATAIEVKSSELPELDLTVREVTFMDRIENDWDEHQGGVIVTSAEMGGWANVAGLRIGDLLAKIDGQPIADLAGFDAATKTLLTNRPAVIEVFCRRGYRTHFVFIEPDWTRIERR